MGHFEQKFIGEWHSATKFAGFKTSGGLVTIAYRQASKDLHANLTERELQAAETGDWSLLEWELVKTNTINQRTLATAAELVITLQDEYFIDNLVQFHFQFSITANRQSKLFEMGKLDLSPTEVLATVKYYQLGNELQSFQPCPVEASLVVTQPKLSYGFGIDSAYDGMWNGGSDPDLNKARSDF